MPLVVFYLLKLSKGLVGFWEILFLEPPGHKAFLFLLLRGPVWDTVLPYIHSAVGALNEQGHLFRVGSKASSLLAISTQWAQASGPAQG